jgi:hypothetical protein
LEVFFAVFSMGVTHEDLVPLFLVTLPLQTHGMLSDLVVFGGAWVLEVEPRNLRFPLIESVLVEFPWGRGVTTRPGKISYYRLRPIHFGH